MPSVKEQIGELIVDKSLANVSVDSLCGAGKRIGVYFSAHWCPPCRGFTPVLSKYYLDMKKTHGDNFEIVFVSLDRSDQAFKEYYETMPWLAVPYDGDRNEIAEKFGVSGIPSFAILNGEDGSIITKDGRAVVSNNKDIMEC